MKFIKIFLLFMFLISSNLAAQSINSIDAIYSEYQKFDYRQVIKLADIFIANSENDSSSILEAYTLKAASYFALNDKNNSRKTFIDLLKIDSTFELSKLSYSPKLLTFYEEIKNEYNDILEEKSIDNKDTNLYKNFELNDGLLTHKNNLNVAFAKSILLPGWGHIDLDNSTKGWVLSTISTAALGTMIYYIVDTKTKESDYLNATNKAQIDEKYSQYNSSYKIRNGLIATYAAIWLYSQIDLLFFNNYISEKNIAILPYYNPYDKLVSLSVQLPLQ